MPLPLKLHETTQVHLEQLIAEHLQEGPHVDFKRQLPGAWDNGAKHELFADVSALANAGGGDLIYGLDEDADGQAASIFPLAENPDETVRRLADFLSTGVEPRIPGVQVQAVSVTVDGRAGSAFIIRVPQSWAGPHRVRSNFKFYIREGNRKRDLDIPEIRGLFLRSESQSQRVYEFRTERVGKIIAGETPCKLVDGPALILHLIPTEAALGIASIDPLPYLESERRIPCLGAQHPGHPRINLDGVVGYRTLNEDNATHAYTQLFRNGFVEGVWVLSRQTDDGNFVLPGTAYEDYAAAFLDRVRAELRHAELTTEVTAMLSIVRADSVTLGFDRFLWDANGTEGQFDRSTIALPDVLVQAEATPHVGLKAVFDLVWQAAGMRGSINFNGAGAWEPRR